MCRQAEASRAVPFVEEQQPEIDWRPGQGLSTSPYRRASRLMHADNRDDLPNRAAFAACEPTAFQTFDPVELTERGRVADVFKLMIGAIVPRPIALCSTVGSDGTESACRALGLD